MSDELKPCPFCGKPLLNHEAGPFNEAVSDSVIEMQNPWHDSRGCYLHGLTVSDNEMMLGFSKRWNKRAPASSAQKGEHNDRD